MRLASRIEEFETKFWDKVLGIDTGGYDNITFTGALNNGYHSKGYFLTWHYLRSLRIGPDDVLYDIGCGAGRVLCIASLGQVKKCIGIELVDSLADRATSNARSLRFRHSPIEIVRANAAKADYSSGTVFVLYNPFGERVVKTILEKVHQDVQKFPRRVRFAYINPFCRNAFDECTWLGLIHERTLLALSAKVCYYENVPGSGNRARRSAITKFRV